ncbi:DNA primase small subunit domain-containing protein [Hyperthermus butylicus]|uniref:DNA primase small subunit PriS n=1 Tax=Hyperthermus butylicus (strain DSM 5456 / JCM 9403 / PLM1-5) TaxID=415426 RepID=PRIS_HYPBU|nr:DNA primase small subunit domain-containing protein [Hyperthermus butylicus]A2BN97.1 RecName: Full=DNA primase small subunit PriS [Hyperthermus butylicus DSM 5456]ABM81458.1 putative DNA primase small subunit [Hyperthermus butylicus DSM 5456]
MPRSQDPVMRTRRFLEHLTRKYYERARVKLPGDFSLREFALQTWTGKSYLRHLSFASTEAVHRLLVEKAPRHFYYSSARYDQPGADDMDAKGWRSADLTFDIDADHLPECSGSIVEVDGGIEGKTSFIEEALCMRAAALRAQILYDILVYELGFDKSRIAIEFSGHRGFHVTVYLDDFDDYAKAGSDVRREIVNYVKALGLRADVLEPWTMLQVRRGKPIPIPPNVQLAGARGRVARIIRRLALRDGAIDIVKAVEGPSTTYSEELREYEDKARQLIGVEIDEQVSVDVKRLIRVPYSINGKTGLLVKPVTVDELDEFVVDETLSPFAREPPVRIRVVTSLPSSVTILGNRLKLREGDSPRLPAPVAVYLMAKGVAVLAQ